MATYIQFLSYKRKFGIPVGNFYQTATYLDLITQVKKENNL